MEIWEPDYLQKSIYFSRARAQTADPKARLTH